MAKELTTRQHNLKNWLEDNYESGRYFTIEEICNANIGYTLNKDPKIHDKCIALGKDVKQLNYRTGVERYIPIIKDKKGSIKLAESKQELNDYIAKEKAKAEKISKYANHLVGLQKLNDTIPFMTQKGRVKKDKEINPINIYATEETRN